MTTTETPAQSGRAFPSNLTTGAHPGVRSPRTEPRVGGRIPTVLPPMLQGELLTRLVQGAAAGCALDTLLLGFGWGGWTLQ